MPYDILIGRDPEDKKRFGDKGRIFIGKGFVKMGNYTSLSNPIYLDIARAHVILVAGKRGAGKCLDGDTLITLADGSQILIKDLAENKEKVLSLNNSLKIRTSERSDFFSRKVNKMLKIKLRSGKVIKLTPEHPLFTIKGWQEAEKLTIGSRIATPRSIPTFGTKEMSEHEIKLLSYLIAEGHTKKIVLFANSDPKIVDEFRESLKRFDSSLELIKEKDNHYRISSPNWKNKIVELDRANIGHGKFNKGIKNIHQKRSIRQLIEREELFGKLSPQKYLSQNILQLKKEDLALFLNRLFSCDGSIYKTNNYWQISYASSSERMIRQIQSLLLRFGIISKLREKNIRLKEKEFKSFELVINSNNIISFIKEIGFFGRKEERQRLALEEMISKKLNPNVDTIPKEIWEFYRPTNWAKVGRALGYKHPKAMRERLRYSPSRQTLLQIARVMQNNPLQLIADSDIFWDEIVAMELLEGDFTVYDICVPENHNFVANDIIVHNSYTLGSIAEQLSDLPREESKNIAPLIFDTMGIFWTMKYKNEKEKELLESWNLKAKNLPARVFVPFGHFNSYLEKGIPADESFSISPSEMEGEDWIITFNLDMTSEAAVLIQKIISKLKDEQEEFFISDIIDNINSDKHSSQSIKNIASGLFEAAKTWGIFSDEKTRARTMTIKDLAKAEVTTILDLSVYNAVGAFNVRALVIGIVIRKLFAERMSARKKEETEAVSQGINYLSLKQKREMPLIWMFVDEIHEFLSETHKTPATDALIQLLREGRQPGISLVMATQQPGALHHDAITQSDIVIAHRVTSEVDLKALNNMMQSYLLSSINKYMDDLPKLKGSAIILDDNSERIYPIRIKPRFTWHGGEAPSAIQAERRI